MRTINHSNVPETNPRTFRTWWASLLTIVMVALSFATGTVSAQSTANYTFATGADASLALDMNANAIDMTTGTTSLVASGSDQGVSSVTNIGFLFFLNGLPYTQFTVSANGVMQLGSTAVSGSTYVASGGTTTSPKLGALTADMITASSADGGGVTMKTVGTAPNRTLVIQWVDYVYWGNTSPAATWQIRLYETTGVIEYVYGSMQVGATTYISNYTTGFSTGTTSGTLACVTTATNANSTASFTTNAYSANANIPNLHSTSNGSRRYYRYTPATPAANPTALNFTAITPTGMTLNWTAASPTTGTVRYAVYLSTDGGTTYNFNNSVALGTNLLAITGLLPSTTYFWRVYSVSEGAFSSTFTSGSQATAAAATYTWNNTGSGVYGTGTNWTPTRSTAASSDILIFDGATTPNPTVTGFASQTIGQIRLTNNANVNFASSATATLTVSGGSSGTDFDIQSGSTLNLNGTSSIGIAFSGTNRSVNIAGTLRTSTTGTGTVNFTNSLATVSGTLDLSSTTNSATSTTANLTIGATGTVICGSNSVVIPTATWNVASNLNITGAVAATSATGAGQSFGNVTYNCAAATGTMSFFTSGTVTIQNLTVTNTNTGRFRALTTGTLNVGNITLNGGTLEVASSTGTINVSGNVTVNGGTLDVTSGTGAATLKIAGTYNQTGGTLNVSGASTTSVMEFNGTVAQNATFGTMGTGAVRVRVNNAAGVNLSGTLSINNGAALLVSNGNFTGSGTITYNATASNLIYNSTTGTQTATAVEFPNTNGPATLTINNTATSPNNVVTLPFARTTGAGSLVLTAGILDNGSNTLTIGNTGVSGISGGSTTSYVRGSLERNLPASLATGSTYSFPIGQSAYNPVDLVNPTTTAAGITSVVARAFDGSTGGTAGTLMATISSTRYWSISQNVNPSNLTNTFLRLNDTRGTQDGIANSATLTGAYNQIGGPVSTLASGSITTTAPALTSLSGFYLMGNLAGPVLTGLSITPSGTQCNNVARTVTVDVTPGAGAITTVTLNYQINGGSNNSVTMTNTTGNTWSGVIPTVTPANATVTWSVTAVDANSVNQTATGTSYKDAPLFNMSSTVAASLTTVCAGSPTVLTGTFAEAGTPVAVGAGASTSSSAGVSFLPGGWGGAKTQYIIRASELTAAGMLPGTSFNSLQYEVTVVGQTYQGFAVSLGLTTQASATTTFINTGLTQVYRGTLTDDGYLPVVGVNTLAFGTGSGSLSSFTWDGTSNILVSICWSRVPAATTSTASTMKVDAPGFTCTSYDQSDSQTPSAECALTTADNTGTSRPKFTFVKAPVTYSTFAWSDGSNIIGSTNPLTVNPTTTTTYTLSAIEAVSGCTLVSSNTVTVTVNPLPTAPNGAPSVQCGTGVPAAFVVSAAGGAGTGTFKWYTVPSGGTAVQTSTSTTYTGTISTTTTFYVSEVGTNGCESPRTAVTATVNQPDAVNASATALACVNGAFSLTTNVTENTNGNVYNNVWTATPAAGSGIPTSLAGGTTTFGTPASATVTPTAAGTYTYTVTATDATLGCATTASVTVTVNALPVINTPTATPNAVCAGSNVTLAATTNVIGAGNVTIGTATTLTGATSQPTAFCNRWPSYRMQTLFTAAELQAAGMSAGNITSMSFNITTLGDGATNANFVVRIGTTTSTAMTAFESNAGYTTVFPSQTYTHAVGVNVINFSTPFNWNGTSNIIVEVQHSGADLTNNSQTYYTATAGNTVAYTLTDATNSASLSTNRLNVVFGAQTQTTGAGGLTWTWNPGVLNGASVTVNPTTTTTYTVTGLNTTTGCANTANVTVTVNDIPADPSTNGSEQCGTQIPTATVSSNSGNPTPTFKWYTAPTGGTAVQTSTSTTYLSNVSTSTTFYVSEISSFGCESGRTPVTVTVSDPDPISVSATPTAVCLGGSFDLATSYTPDFNNFATFDLTTTGGAASGVTGTVSLTPNATGSDAYTITPTAAGTYTYTVSAFDPDKGCTSVGTVTVVVTDNPPVPTVSATPATICAGQSAVLSAVILGGSTTGTIGTGTVSNTTSTPYKGFWGGNKQQMLYTAAELSSLGLFAGSSISAVGFNITAFTSPYTFNGFTIAMKNTSSTVLTTTLETGTTTVFGPTNYTLTGTAPFTVSHTLTTPFTWDGTSNLLVEFCFNNNNGGGVSANSANVASSTTASNLTVYYSADNTATVCSAPGTGSVTTTRPNIRLTYTPNNAASYNWSWDNGAGSTPTVTVSPTTTTTYIATATTPSTTCSTPSASITVTVNPLPDAPVTNSPVTRCGPGSVTLTATGSGGTLKWYTVSTGGTSVATGGSYAVTVAVGTVTYYVAETSAAGCEGPRTAVTVTATTPPTLAITPSGPTTFCAGGSVTLNGASASDPSYDNFSWTPSTGLSATNTASVTANPTTTTTYTVTATNPDGCINTASVTITVNPNPSIGAATASPATICVGGNSSLSTNSTGPNTAPGTYCTADASGGAGSNPITNVTFGNINNTQATQVSPYSYTYPASGTTTTTVYSSQSYDLTVTSGTASIASVWFDWNRNGVYEASEWTQLWTSATTGTISVTVPSNATPGLTGMRIRTRGTGNSNGSTDACSSFFSGTAQDYLITVIGGANPSYNYTWNPGAISGASISVSPTSTTSYTVTASDPVTGCTTTSNAVTVTVQTVGATASASPSTPVCAGTSVTLNGGATGGGPFTYVWNDGTSNFSTAASPVVNPTVTTTYTVIVTDLCGNPSAPSSVTVVVNPLPTASIQEAGPITICQPATQTLTAVTDAATPAYQWTLNGVNIPSATGSTYTINTVSTGAYRVIVTNTTTNCVSAVSAPVTVTLNPQPAAVSIAPTSATICNGSSVTLTASGGTTGGSGNAILGTATTITSATSQPTAFCNRWAQYWNQTIYTAAELTAAGLTAGTSITSLTYNITTLGDAATNANYRVRIANTASSTLSAFQTTGFTTVYGPSTYTHAVGTNLITFTTPFVWNGTSNIIIDVRHDGIDNLNNAQTYFTAAADNKNISAITSTTSATTSIETLVANATVTGTASTTRLNIVLGYSSLQNPTWSWTPTTGLATSNTAAVVASPSTTTSYTATATNGFGCTTSSAPVTVTVNPRPTAVVSGSAAYCQNQPASTNLSIAFTGTGPWTYTLNGSDASTVTATTSSNPVTVTVNPNSATAGVVTYTVSALSDANCASIGADLTGSGTVTINPLAATPTANVTQPTCAVATGSITMTAPLGAGNSYTLDGTTTISWPSITFSGVAPGPHTITVANSFGCSAPASASVTVNPQPFIPSAPTVSGPTNVCPFLGNSTQVTYTATAAGATSYNWVLPPNVNLISGAGTGTIVVTFNAAFGTQANKQIKVTASSVCGTSATQTIYYLLVQFPSTPAPIVASTLDVCSVIGTSNTITFTIPKVAGASSYIWTSQAGTTVVTHPNGSGANDTTITVSFSNAFTTSAITVAAVNDCGTSGTRSITLTKAAPSTPSPISGPTNACAFISPSTTAATYTVPAQTNASSYTWTLPVGATNVTGQGTNTISFIYPAGYTGGTISVTASNGCGTSSARSLTIATLSPATPSVIDVINTAPCPNRVYTYSVAAMPANATSLNWTIPAAGTIVSGQGTTSITVSYPGTAVSGTVTVAAVNNCGSSVTRSVDVKLPACPPPAFASTSNAPSKGTNVAPQVADLDVTVFPNPTVSDFKLQVQTASKEMIHVRVLDMTGREYKVFQLVPGSTLSLGRELKAGSYILEVRQGKSLKTTKVLKF